MKITGKKLKIVSIDVSHTFTELSGLYVSLPTFGYPFFLISIRDFETGDLIEVKLTRPEPSILHGLADKFSQEEYFTEIEL